MTLEARQERSLRAVLYLFTAVTGLVDAVSFIGLGHIFTANMTGNIVLLGFASARVAGLSVLRSLTALAAFLLGALIGGRIAARPAPGHKQSVDDGRIWNRGVIPLRSNTRVDRLSLVIS